MTTRAPCRANARAVARPMPDAPPVITTTLPVMSLDIFGHLRPTHEYESQRVWLPTSRCPDKTACRLCELHVGASFRRAEVQGKSLATSRRRKSVALGRQQVP